MGREVANVYGSGKAGSNILTSGCRFHVHITTIGTPIVPQNIYNYDMALLESQRRSGEMAERLRARTAFVECPGSGSAPTATLGSSQPRKSSSR